jgi:hypothetical protein
MAERLRHRDSSQAQLGRLLNGEAEQAADARKVYDCEPLISLPAG